MTKYIVFGLSTVFLSFSALANDYWQRYSAKETDQFGVEATYYGLQSSVISSIIQSDMHITVPAADGSMHTYALTPSRVLPDALARKYPQLQSYVGIHVDHPELKGRFDCLIAVCMRCLIPLCDGTMRTFVDPVNATKHRVYRQ